MNNTEVCERFINSVLVVIRTTLHFLNQIFRGRLLAGIEGSKPTSSWMSASCDFLCCQVDVCPTGWSLVQRSPTDFGLSNQSDRVVPARGGHDLESSRSTTGKKELNILYNFLLKHYPKIWISYWENSWHISVELKLLFAENCLYLVDK